MSKPIIHTHPNETGGIWVEWHGRQMLFVSPDQFKNIREMLKASIEDSLAKCYAGMAELREGITVFREMEEQVDTVELAVPPDDVIAEMKRDHLEDRALHSHTVVSNIARDAIHRMSDDELKGYVAVIENENDLPF